MAGSLPGVKRDKNAKVTSSTCSYVLYLRMEGTMVIICLAICENMGAMYGGVKLGGCSFETMKFLNTCLALSSSIELYGSRSPPMEKGAKFGLGWTYNI